MKLSLRGNSDIDVAKSCFRQIEVAEKRLHDLVSPGVEKFLSGIGVFLSLESEAKPKEGGCILSFKKNTERRFYE